jgi:hypothetical protein
MKNTRLLSRTILSTAAAALLAVGCGGGAPGSSNGSLASAHDGHHRCGWIGADTADAGRASFLAHPEYFDAIHPKWGTLRPDGSVRLLSLADDAQIMAAAKANGVKVMPLIDYDDKSYFQAAAGDPQGHARALADLVQQHGWDGVELDYEHLWSSSYRAGYQAVIGAVSDALHAQGKQLSVAVSSFPAANPDSAYDYGFLQAHVDVVHLMGYDYHWFGGDHAGPLAPKGWISDVTSYVQSLGQPGKYILGIANYGIAPSWYASARESASRCGGSYSSSTDHMSVCPYGHQEAGLAPHCQTSDGEVWFEDLASMKEKAQLAQQHGLAGVGLWTVGDEPDGFFEAMANLF